MIKFIKIILFGESLSVWRARKDREFKRSEEKMWEQVIKAIKG